MTWSTKAPPKNVILKKTDSNFRLINDGNSVSPCYVGARRPYKFRKTSRLWNFLIIQQLSKPNWLRYWLNTVLAVCVICQIMTRERLQLTSWNLAKWNICWWKKCDVFVVSMATWMIEYNLKISLLFSLHKIRSLDFPINLHTAYYN